MKKLKALSAILFVFALSLNMLACAGKSENNTGRTESTEDSSSQTTASRDNANGIGQVSGQSKEASNVPGAAVTAPANANAKLASPSTTGRLKVSGTRIVGQNGQEVQLRGISTHGLAWFPEFVNNQAFSEFRNSWGANVIRLAMYTAENGGYCTGGNKSQLLSTIYDGVEYATKNDMYAIIDWHVLNDNDPNRYKAEAKDFWANISKKYAGYNNLIYEICNEPCGGTSWEAIKNYANEIIPVIRANDPNAIIVVGTPNWSQEVDKAAASPITGYSNIMYTLHFYAATHKADLQSKMLGAIRAGLPIMVTEFGICDASGNGGLDIASANSWVQLMNDNGISYVCWNLSNKNESSALIKASCSKTSGFTLSDLSDEGKWLYELLSKAAATGVTALPAGGAGSSGSNAGQNNSGATNTSPNNVVTSGKSLATIGSSKTINSGSIQVIMTQSNGWDEGAKVVYQYTCSITNKSDTDLNNWSFSIDLGGNVSLKDGWNANYKANGNRLEISNKDYNATIKAGQSISDIGFIVIVG